jgi:ring-1,2-phenylacetyl-CoA epoxidase subunit PaaE
MSQFQSLAVTGLRRETRDSVSLGFAIPAALQDSFRFHQGQYLTLRTEIDGEEVRRSYSICSGISDGEIRVAIKKVEGGRFSTFANEQLQEGDCLDVMPPMGNFYTELDPARAGHYLLVAAGSGVTPIMSIAKSILEVEPQSRVTLLYGNRSTASTMFREPLEDLKNSYMERLNLIFVFSREQQDIDLYNGHIDAAKCQQLFQRWIDVRQLEAAFICGPQAMTETVRDSLREFGLSPERIHFELFAAAGNEQKRAARVEAAARSSRHAAVTVIRDGHSINFDLAWNTSNILDAANELDADLPYSCKAGVCSTCKCRVIEGEVEMDVNTALEDYEVEAGYVLSCQSYPVSDRVVLDFDQL